jgi:toluene monooxygenase system protein E
MGTRTSMSARRTYWHLEGRGQTASEYEIVTSRLLYYPGRGFEPSTPLAAWYAEHQGGSLLRCPDGELFSDPRATTYSSYIALQQRQESDLDDLVAALEDSGHDRKLPSRWISTLAGLLPPLRYPMHGLQMLSAYVGHMAPGGRIVVVCALQAADEVRRIQRFAYRMRQLQDLDPSFGEDAKARWQDGAAWQPLRRLVEHLLVTYDWGESLVALNVVLKPRFDELFMVRFARAARDAGDTLLESLLGSLHADCQWHQAWTTALLDVLLASEAENRAVVSGWVEKWQPQAETALAALEPLLKSDERGGK